MIVLHAAWLLRTDGLCLWAEGGGPAVAVPRRGRQTRKRRPEPHPDALDTDGIRLALAELGGFAAQDAIAKAVDTDVSLELPLAGSGPARSPWLEDDVSAAQGANGSSGERSPAWTAPAIVVEPPQAADLVLALTTANPADTLFEQSGIVPAFDLRFAARSAEMVLELITRGRFLPDLELAGDGWRARWRPLVDARDRGRIEALVWALPLSFMAADSYGPAHDRTTAGREEKTPGQVLRSYMWSLTDALARRFVTDVPIPVPVSAGQKRLARKPDAVSAWLSALRSPDGSVEADAGELQALSGAIAVWHATVNTESEPVRTCFRIIPPTDDDAEEDSAQPEKKHQARRRKVADDWQIEFALQAVDDPSLLVTAETVWEDGPELAALERHVEHPDEHLLRGLGRAARLVPSIGSALTAAMPVAQTTDATGALEFLRDSAPVLEQAGFGVLAPPWWRSSKRRVSLRLKARMPSVSPVSTNSSIGLDALCKVEWEAVLGDDMIGLAELRQLARLKQPLVRIRGQWVELREGDIAAAIAAVDRKGRSADQMSAGEVVRSALGIDPITGDLPIAAVVADGWLGDLLAGAEDRRLDARPTPDGFVGELRPYQERGLGWLAFLGDLGLGACLADDMGLGKTAQLLALLLDQRSGTKGPTLVLCPMSLVGNWERETARFAPGLSVYVHHGQNRLDGKAFTRNARKADLVLSTYGLAARDRELLASVTWSRLVLDEAQQIKEQRGTDDPERADDPCGSPDRDDRHTRGEPAERTVVDHAVPQSGSARLGEGIPRALRHSDRA